MSLATIVTDGPRVVRPVTLDELWREAESLGRVKVDNSFVGESYEVSIQFERGRHGTRICAKGKHPDIIAALELAIDEARENGAGEQP